MVAPYLPWSQVCHKSNSILTETKSDQLLYLLKHPKSYIHAIYASTDALLYLSGIEKLITALNLTVTSPSLTYVAKPKLLSELGLNEEQFLDIGILAGFQHSPAFPPIAHDSALKAAIEMLKYYKNGFSTVSMYSDHPGVKAMNYLDIFARTRTMMKYSLILTSEGAVLPLQSIQQPNHSPSPGDIPSDFHEVYTHRLPDEAYFYLSRGLLGPQPLDWLTSGYINEPPPLDNGETTEYKRFVKEVITEGQTGPRATALALISSVLHNFWVNRRVQGCFWFEPFPGGQKNFNNVSHNSRETAALAERVAGWNVPYAVIEEELRRQNVSLQV